MKQASFHCPQCRQQKLFQAAEMNHTPHILASVFLCGMWLPIWLLTALSYREQWHCSFCGYHDAVAYLSNPNLRVLEQQRAAERERVREAVRISREGSTIQEHLAYFVSDNKGWLIGGAIFAVFAGLALIGITAANQAQLNSTASRSDPRSTPTVDPNELQRQANRKEFASTSQANFSKGFPGITFTTTGSRNDVLTVQHATATRDDFSRRFTPEIKKQIRDLGFVRIVLTNGKGEIQITP